jgi:hypothetical protein
MGDVDQGGVGAVGALRPEFVIGGADLRGKLAAQFADPAGVSW